MADYTKKTCIMPTNEKNHIETDNSPRRGRRVLFVCLGNICRSPAAEGVMRALIDQNGESALWEIDSAGTGGWHVGQLPDQRMRLHARRRGLELTHHCRQVREADFSRFDWIVGMDSQNIADLRALAPTPADERKILPMGRFLDPQTGYDHVPDPYYEGSEGFELVLDLLRDGCARLRRFIETKASTAAAEGCDAR